LILKAYFGDIQDSKPVEFVGQMKDAAQFYANRVVKEFKDR
jgi:hypothetical protein